MSMPILRKILSMVLMAVLVLSSTGCAADTYKGNTANNSTNTNQTYIEEMNGDYYSYYVDKVVVNIPTVSASANSLTNADVLQFLYQGGYVAYDKNELSGTVSEDMLNSFSTDKLIGWDGKAYQYALLGRYYQDYVDQPILWRVLGVKNGRALLVSEYILDTRPFDSISNDWLSSDLYDWLNSTFLTKAFSQDEFAAILHNNEVGSVFLLSRAELSNTAYGFNKSIGTTDPNRRAMGTMYAFSNNLWVVQESEYTNYYARSKSNNTNVDLVTSNGKIMQAKISRDNVGIRPAVWVDLNKLTFTNGSGTVAYPFQ